FDQKATCRICGRNAGSLQDADQHCGIQPWTFGGEADVVIPSLPKRYQGIGREGLRLLTRKELRKRFGDRGAEQAVRT
ncbi:hypothetical protein, partial [Mycobacteroides chelonae]|uniref:hypothetical protein n=1 Tax=Mycobacteroides chelonae TaxID=1774 RepID=UPI001A957274